MATKQATVTSQREDKVQALIVQWTGVTETDTFAPLTLPDYVTKSVHVSGTFGGATVVLNGSNTGANFLGLHDPQGVAISLTQEGLKQVQENVLQYQPAASGGTGQSLTVTMLFVKGR